MSALKKSSPGPTILPNGTRDWSAYNATIVGAVYPAVQPSAAYPPGLEATQGPNARPPPYRPVSFGATRDYKDDNDGWQKVKVTKKSRSRRWKGAN